MAKGFISISETSWLAMGETLPSCAGITVERTLSQQIGAKPYRIICFSYQLGCFSALVAAMKGGPAHD